MSTELSAGAKAAALRAQAAPRGLKRRVLALVDMDRQGARLQAEAGRWEAGLVGEQRTAALLAPLAREGWYGLYDRAIPGGPLGERRPRPHLARGPGADA